MISPDLRTRIRQMMRVVVVVSIALGVSACAKYGTVKNTAIKTVNLADGYSVPTFHDKLSSTDNGIVLALSGGGTRAAAFAYGVMQELRATQVNGSSGANSLLDDVGLISSVSGGSFTAAYYGLHGDQMFSDFENGFLRKDIEGALFKSVLNPVHLFSRKSRTEYAIDYYDREVFGNATFADMIRPDAPMVLINATDLVQGVRFTFTQEYFNLLCSDISSFPVSRAVTSSSAVPLLFTPVLVENHDDCGSEIPDWLEDAKARSDNDAELALTVEGLESYFNKADHKYAHFVDGGITDNLGLRSIFDMAKIAGGGKALMEHFNIEVSPRVVIISVDASTDPESTMGVEKKSPSMLGTINAMTNVQLHRYNTATVSEMQETVEDWVNEISTEEKPVESYFIRLAFDQVKNVEQRRFLSGIPTSFSLTGKQIDAAISAGRTLLRDNSEFQRLLKDIR